jgi:hypothetical protein
MEVREMLLLGPFTFFFHSFLISLQIERGLSVVTQKRVKEWRSGGRFEGHLNIDQHIIIHKHANFPAKSYRRYFHVLLVRCPLLKLLNRLDLLPLLLKGFGSEIPGSGFSGVSFRRSEFSWGRIFGSEFSGVNFPGSHFQERVFRE